MYQTLSESPEFFYRRYYKNTLVSLRDTLCLYRRNCQELSRCTQLHTEWSPWAELMTLYDLDTKVHLD